MSKIKILVADSSYLIREGLRSIINDNSDFKLMGEAENPEALLEKLTLYRPNVLAIDYASSCFCLDDVALVHEKFPEINILAITIPQSKEIISIAIENGVTSHLLKDCGKDEIIEAIYNAAKGEKFFCGKIIDTILKEKPTPTSLAKTSKGISCDGIKLSPREIEIIQLIAEGLSNKKIAERLFLSVHTVTTHRKNIMNKLGVNNTAGLVMFAIKENLLGPNKFLFAN